MAQLNASDREQPKHSPVSRRTVDRNLGGRHTSVGQSGGQPGGRAWAATGRPTRASARLTAERT